jgi:hypothetical protein
VGTDADLATASCPEVSLRSPSIHTYSHTREFRKNNVCDSHTLCPADGDCSWPDSTLTRRSRASGIGRSRPGETTGIIRSSAVRSRRANGRLPCWTAGNLPARGRRRGRVRAPARPGPIPSPEVPRSEQALRLAQQTATYEDNAARAHRRRCDGIWRRSAELTWEPGY